MPGEQSRIAAGFSRLGAATAIATLWEVGDEAAVEFSEEFFACIAAGRPAAEAFAAAQQRVRRIVKDEVTRWAAFVHWES